MVVKELNIDTSFQKLVADITLKDVEEIRMVLAGGSAIDWYRLRFNTREEVDAFLRVNEFYPENPGDIRRLKYIFESAKGYLEDNFSYHFPREINNLDKIEDIFLMASRDGEFQNLACIILKVMHIINHIEGREARYKLPVTQEMLFRTAEEKVSSTVARMLELGFPITQYKTSRKSRDSLITKLLSKPTTIASQIFDRLRFRIIVASQRDLLPVLAYLTRHLFPFNYVVPGESRNDIIKIRKLLDMEPQWRPILDDLDYDFQLAEETLNVQNPFSAQKFKMTNVVIDLPLRVEKILKLAGIKRRRISANVVFQLIEFQIFDQKTFQDNETGESAHDTYKNRQKWKVINRLMYGNSPLRNDPIPSGIYLRNTSEDATPHKN